MMLLNTRKTQEKGGVGSMGLKRRPWGPGRSGTRTDSLNLDRRDTQEVWWLEGVSLLDSEREGGDSKSPRAQCT